MCPNYAVWLNPLQSATYAPVTPCAIIMSRLHHATLTHYILHPMSCVMRLHYTLLYVSTTSCANLHTHYVLHHMLPLHRALYASYVQTTYYTTSSTYMLHHMSQVHTVPYVPFASSAIRPEYIIRRTSQLHNMPRVPSSCCTICPKYTLSNMSP